MDKKSVAGFFLLFLMNVCFCQTANFETFNFSAHIDNVTTPNAGMAAALDKDHNTHIAWIEQKDGLRSVMYSLYDGSGVTTTKVYQGADKEAPVAPAITLANNNPHITFFVERNTDISLNTGNYAVYYAAKNGGDFHVEQVSTNPTNPEEDTDGIYHCYVNGRPQITNKNGTIVITYISATGSFNGWDNYLISATKASGTWNLKQEYNIDELANVSPDDDVSLPVYSSDDLYHAFIDMSDYDPFVCYNNDYGWNSFMITGYSESFANDDLHIDYVNQSKYFLSWLHGGDSKTAFIGINLSGSQETTEFSITNTPGGNFAPSTYDLTTGDFVGFYNESLSSDAYLVTAGENNTVVETQIPDIGIVYGKRVLNARDGYISLVTARESDEKIYISTSAGNETESLEAAFIADSRTINVGDAVTFSDTSLGNPTAWNWTFPGGEPATSTEQNPVVTYKDAGEYDAKLIIENATTRDTLLKEALLIVNNTNDLEPEDYWQGACWNLLEPETNQQYADYLKNHDFYVDESYNFYISHEDTLIKIQNAKTVTAKMDYPVASYDSRTYKYNLRDISPQGNQAYQSVRFDTWAGYPTSSLIIRNGDGQDLYTLPVVKELGIIESCFVGNQLHVYFYLNKTVANESKTIDFGNNISVTTNSNAYQYYRLIFDEQMQPATLNKIFVSDFDYPPTNTVNKDIRTGPDGAFVIILYRGSFTPVSGSEITLNNENKSMVVFDKTGLYQYHIATEINLYETQFFINSLHEVFFTITKPQYNTIDGMELPDIENASARKYLLKYDENGIQWALALNNYLNIEGAETIIESGYSIAAILADDNSMYIPSGGLVVDAETGERESFSAITRIIPEGEINWVYTTGRQYARINGAVAMNNHLYVPMTYGNNPDNQTSTNTIDLFSSTNQVKLGDIDHSAEANVKFMMALDLNNECLFSPSNTTNAVTNQLKQEFMVYPNPSSNIFHIKLPEACKGNTLKVLDLTGRIVYRQQVLNQQEIHLDLSGYQKGMYMLQLSGNQQKYTTLIQKQ